VQNNVVEAARSRVRTGDVEGAEAVLAQLIAENFDLPVKRVRINLDWTSLNSLNGRVATEQEVYFFKFHHEEGEESTVQEYYRGELLQNAGYPVDMPLMICRKPGRQILLYRFRNDLQMAAACLEIERKRDFSKAASLMAAQADLDRLIGNLYVKTLHSSDARLSEAEPIHQLFHARLCDPDQPNVLGGRWARFYRDRSVALAGEQVPWHEFSRLRWRVNGIDYTDSLEALFSRCLTKLAPQRLANCGAVVAHGDAHNANVWIEQSGGDPHLVLFDPAFAGAHVPALLAEVKATFHNIFAHPFWLYHPAEAHARFRLRMRRDIDRLEIEHDWALNPLRSAFLDSKVQLVWRPLLTELKARQLLPSDWREILRCSLFACPTLVLNLLGQSPGDRSGEMSLLAFAMALSAGSEPESNAHDPYSEFLDAIAP
jgi:hypothetical protein